MVNNKKYYLKRTWKQIYVAQKIFDNSLAVTPKIKIILMLNKKVHVRMFILELCRVTMYEFQHEYSNRTRLSSETGGLIYKIESENYYKNFRTNTEMLDFKELFFQVKISQWLKDIGCW